MSDREVVVTGIGLITPCGIGWKPYWEAVSSGTSHVTPFEQFVLNGFPSKLAGQIPNFNPSEFIKKRKNLKVMSREIMMAVAASQLAVEDSGLSMAEEDAYRMGISLGTGIINTELDELGYGIKNSVDEAGHFQMKKFGKEGIRSMFPLWFLKYLPNMPACHVSLAHGLKGPNNTVTTSAAAGAQAIGEAFDVIRRNDADVVFAGSTDSKINAMGISRFHLLDLLSRRSVEDSKAAYCAFDERSDGIILGEGAGILILEEKQHAQKRGARIYGQIKGYGSASDFNYDPRLTRDYTGKHLAMERALFDAKLNPADIDFLLANGSGIPHEDIQEVSAIHAVFKKEAKSLRVSAVKPITGHMVYGSGGVEIAAGLLALNENLIPPIINLERIDPQCEMNFVKAPTRLSSAKSFLFNSFGFGGQNASLAVTK